MQYNTVITGTGSFIPSLVKTNRDFAAHDFYDEQQNHINQPPALVAQKFQQITGIEERRYASCELNSSDLALNAAREAIRDSGVDPETIDQIIVAHNFGNVVKHTIQTDLVPSIASRVKHGLDIRNSACVPYDILFGCPGWLQGLIQADAFIKAGVAKKCLVIGTETLSRVIDAYDRDSMIFSDGAGACVVEALPKNGSNQGVLASSVLNHSNEEAYFLYMGKSNFPGSDTRVRYLKMQGRKVFEYAMKHVPSAMKACLDKCGIDISEVKKIFLHQANEKMDEGFTRELFKLYGHKTIPPHIMPMSIHKLGNSSVATIPTLFDLVRKGELPDQELHAGDVILFASVGAGMNINAVCYRI
ncbi:3-oxoacyl-ACP synthase III family protein [Solitalea koreensis]|uniref:3-oxoacyl-[acyl-carrier-protein] synthase-3 n=1 Tax=Solitalea koreensis TaxID=543615 RepID=A0A521BD47_9SPHI|nr:ketoacyl-ACP synthase III [Solitalea koreensis]SMO45028.1 3-oxoacyl-[acyl-carrier-protein] synthase-3 [Solitalea koreensis]